MIRTIFFFGILINLCFVKTIKADATKQHVMLLGENLPYKIEKTSARKSTLEKPLFKKLHKLKDTFIGGEFNPQTKQRAHKNFINSVQRYHKTLTKNPPAEAQFNDIVLSVFNFLRERSAEFGNQKEFQEMWIIYIDPYAEKGKYKVIQEIVEKTLEKEGAETFEAQKKEYKEKYEIIIGDKAALNEAIKQKPVLALIKRDGMSFIEAMLADSSIARNLKIGFIEHLRSLSIDELKALFYQIFKNTSYDKFSDEEILYFYQVILEEINERSSGKRQMQPVEKGKVGGISFTVGSNISMDPLFKEEESLPIKKAYEVVSQNLDKLIATKPLLVLLKKDPKEFIHGESLEENFVDIVSPYLETLNKNEVKAISYYLFGIEYGNEKAVRPIGSAPSTFKDKLDKFLLSKPDSFAPENKETTEKLEETLNKIPNLVN